MNPCAPADLGTASVQTTATVPNSDHRRIWAFWIIRVTSPGPRRACLRLHHAITPSRCATKFENRVPLTSRPAILRNNVVGPNEGPSREAAHTYGNAGFHLRSGRHAGGQRLSARAGVA